ncbi:MAG: hypothetical protein IV094_07465 [Vitreoscilla sp.]|nr:hypothetical protein [Vitreoscilla sp.]
MAIQRLRSTVYVVGAGFSKGCGYPLTKELLPNVWSRLGKGDKNALGKIVRFHHPQFDPERPGSFPGIEELLTEIAVNLDLFESSRWRQGALGKDALVGAHQALLGEIAVWFHELFDKASAAPWLKSFVERLRNEDAGIVSFNWDLLLDEALFGSNVNGASYGLQRDLPKRGPLILKPHGSLNWYLADDIQAVAASRRRSLFEADDPQEDVEAFVLPRTIRSKAERTYTPLLVAPTYLKDFRRPIFRRLWRHSTDLLSTPERIIFLGYSLPKDDLQARFILRCGFHNQLKGILKGRRSSGASLRGDPTGNAEVVVVDPDKEAAKRIRGVVNLDIKLKHFKGTVEEWLESEQ